MTGRFPSQARLDAAYDALARHFAMLAEPARLKIMHAVCEGERSVGEIVRATRIAQTNVSRHLGLLHRAGLVERRRSGSQIYYRVADEHMPELCRIACARLAAATHERLELRRDLLRLAE
jgi:DNA-binding transcriptional ArsR family regulator